jgi:hypothetical protein
MASWSSGSRSKISVSILQSTQVSLLNVFQDYHMSLYNFCITITSPRGFRNI